MKTRLTKGATRDLKKFESDIRHFVVDTIHKLAVNPTKGKPLKGALKKYRSFRCRFSGTEYRIIYRVDMGGDLITIVLIGTRENIYKELKKRISHK